MLGAQADMPDIDLRDRTVLVTGGNGGLGLEVSKALASRGARVLLACRNPARGAAAVEAVRAHGAAEYVALDLADIASVRRSAAAVRALTEDRLDVLVNNAGVLCPKPRRLPDGSEVHFAINHLGHAALTWLLMPALRGVEAGRVVVVGSLAARHSGFDPQDPDCRRRTLIPYRCYGESKAANLLFAAELGRRLAGAGERVEVVAAHPGVAHTTIASGGSKGLRAAAVDRVYRVIGADPADGAAPIVAAATRVGLRTGAYLGPGGWLELRGRTVSSARLPRLMADRATAQHLWELTAARTGVVPDPD